MSDGNKRKLPCVYRIYGMTTFCETCGHEFDTGVQFECPYSRENEADYTPPWWLPIGFVAGLLLLAALGGWIIKLILGH